MKSLLTIAAILCVTGVSAQTIPCSRPLSEKQIIDLVQSKIPDGRLQSTVTDCGITFSPNDETLGRLRDAGATSVVLVSVRRKGEQQSWDGVKNSQTARPIEEFLRTFPSGQFASDARAKLASVQKLEEVANQARLGGLKLEQAHQEVASLETRIQEIAKSRDSNQERALAKLNSEYESRRSNTAQIKPKDMFESDAEFAERIEKTKQALSELNAQHMRERDRIRQGTTSELTQQTRELRRQIQDLRERQYPVEGAVLEFISYDANREWLVAAINGQQYWFKIRRDSARELYSRWSKARFVQSYEDDPKHPPVVVVDTETGVKYAGIPKGAAEEIERRGNVLEVHTAAELEEMGISATQVEKK
jgi:hypothetical protein